MLSAPVRSAAGPRRERPSNAKPRMTAFASPKRRSKLPLVLFVVAIVLGALVAGGAYLWPRFESEPPQIVLASAAEAIGRAPVEIRLTDRGAGLRSFAVTLQQGGVEHRIAAEDFDRPVNDKAIAAALAKVPDVKEGPSVLRITARDAALWRGNAATLEKRVTIDVTPPKIELVADDRYVSFGGAGAIVYKASPDTVTSGVRIGNHFFPGFAGQVKDHPDRWFALFAHPYDVAPEARPMLVATDRAGNTRELRLDYALKKIDYRKSTIALNESLVQNKVAPLLGEAAARQGSPMEVFLAVNRRLRQDNEARITEITRRSTPAVLWQGAFVQLSNSKVEANFADLRTYTWNGEPVDTAYHLGYDLSVTRRYPVEAANSGKVVFAGDLGIYGNTVILDHGLGLFTLYGHLSAIDVKEGDTVAKRQIIGKTGETGLAAGDHLHYGVYVSGVPVLPVEWWDAKWIDDNITPKLQGRSGEQIAAAQAPARGKAKATKTTAAVKRRR